MRFSFGQELRQEQKQVLSQRMIQSMEILQLSAQQLEDRIEQELADNPMLEIDDDSEAPADTADLSDVFDEHADGLPNSEESPEELRDRFIEQEREIDIGGTPNSETDFRVADEFAALYSDTIDEAPARSQNWLEEAADRHGEMIANIPTRSQTLSEHLIDQLSWYDPSEPLRDMAERIIFNLDKNGFFPETLEQFLGPTRTDKELELARQALALVRKLDPPGIAVTDVRECLLSQLTPDLSHRDVLVTLISDHLDDIQHNRLPLIARKTGYSLTTIQEAIAEMRHLTPYPAATFTEEAAAAVIPDVILEKTEDGRYEVHADEGRFPKLRVSPYYRELLKQRLLDKGTRDYIKQNAGSAQWLIDSILQRQSTLQKVAQAIVDYQHDFFDIGPEAIKPLKMQQIADIVGVHVTTISRTCDDKWMLTPRGLVPLRRFFTSAMPSADEEGGEIAQDAVRMKLREIIDKEEKTDPLSDEAIVEEMEKAGIKIARRTVVKYRQAMGIPSSRQRRVW